MTRQHFDPIWSTLYALVSSNEGLTFGVVWEGRLRKVQQYFCFNQFGHFEKLCRVTYIIIWLAPRAGKMNQISQCDWLPERARWSHLARSGLPAVSCKKNFLESHIINPILTKFVRSRWLDIGLVLSLRVYVRLVP